MRKYLPERHPSGILRFASLDADVPQPGDGWRLNFRRKERVRDSSADWQYPISYYAEDFGRAVFVE